MTYKITLPNGELRVSNSDFARKNPTLSIQKGNEIKKIASFNNLESMNLFLELFNNTDN